MCANDKGMQTTTKFIFCLILLISLVDTSSMYSVDIGKHQILHTYCTCVSSDRPCILPACTSAILPRESQRIDTKIIFINSRR